ncbi:hypothetical protein FRC14_005795 [Serendipita sp. 396]|nr:hypothetical protein FRC14_005795 [Serendipita sp. 396]KAG8872295.1 hypothetical protein FRC20_009597 [Serendipita sp. 405]
MLNKLLELLFGIVGFLYSILTGRTAAITPTTNVMEFDTQLNQHLERGKPLLGRLVRRGPEDGHNDMADWMKSLPDERPLNAITYPGTHDAAAYNYAGEGHHFWNCQTQPLLQQLDSGIRALDLRYALKDGKLLFFHSIALLDEGAEVVDIIWGLHGWLREHPHETIIVSLKVDNGDPYAADVQEHMQRVLDDTSRREFWVADVTTRTTLREARGKLVLMRRFPYGQPVGFGVSEDWKVNDGNFKIALDSDRKTFAQIEDFYLLIGRPRDTEWQLGEKEKATMQHLERAQAAIEHDSGDLWITFSSAVGDRRTAPDEDVTPRVMALGRDNVQGINQRMKAWCRQHPSKPLGIVFMDFVTIQRKDAGLLYEEEPDTDLIRLFAGMQRPH